MRIAPAESAVIGGDVRVAVPDVAGPVARDGQLHAAAERVHDALVRSGVSRAPDVSSDEVTSVPAAGTEPSGSTPLENMNSSFGFSRAVPSPPST